LDFQDRYDIPFYLGESGENDDAWITKFRQVLDSHQIGWAFWPYKKMTVTSCMVSLRKPDGWDKVVKFLETPRDTFEKVREAVVNVRLGEAKEIFATLLDNIRLPNTQMNPGFIEGLGVSVPQHIVTRI
jgi:endoglucanase